MRFRTEAEMRAEDLARKNAMIRLLDDYGWTCYYEHPPWSYCWRRLENPAHRCTHDWPRADNCLDIDHHRWLRRGTGRKPTQWGLLTQPYNDNAMPALAEWAAAHGAVGVVHAGRAPYGHGTTAYIIEGQPR